jgi:aerobic carbon-monoxide dehydrogenase small subunit
MSGGTPEIADGPDTLTANVRLTVNGEDRELAVAPTRRLISVLREEWGLTGTKIGCEVGICGACTVLVDGEPTSSCLTLAVQTDGRDVCTIEGLGEEPEFAALQRQFLEHGGSQCGFCTSGQLVALAAVQRREQLSEMSREEIVEQLHGNLCRCTGYYGILRAAEGVES